METETYLIFKDIHIASYLIWLLAFAGSLFFAARVSSSSGTEQEKKSMRRERLVTSIGAHIGALGILISGPAMVSISGGPQWGWFPFHQFTWLAVKQVIFIVILILVVFSVKKSVAFKKQIGSEKQDIVSNEARNKWRSAYRISLAVYILVAFNTYLGLARPF